ncbi:hypothetical protein BGZ79_006985 [Entomortierella chlamydospora]|nr:hypothetical protein BGZ79_006985 [Entomortierella chlamydospora]
MDVSKSPSRRRFIVVALIISAFLFLAAIQLGLGPLRRFNSDGKYDDNSLESHSLPPSSETKPDVGSSQVEEPLQLEGNKEHDPFLTMFPERPPADQERFLAYLPHSGFHNQRMSLETALRLAAYLNRTLLLPPLYMCEKALNIPWGPAPSLLEKWKTRTREGVEYCKDYNMAGRPRPTPNELRNALENPHGDRDLGCVAYHSWTTVPWTYFFDLPKVLVDVVHFADANLTEPIRVFDRPNMTISWLAERLGITESIEKEIYWIEDFVRADYRILDDSEYDYRLYPEPPGRVEARSDAHIALASYIVNALDIWNQEILDATKLAEAQIRTWINETNRAASGFLGAHLRTADGGFVHVIDSSLQRIVEWIRKVAGQDKQHSDDPLLLTRSGPTKRQEENVPTFLDRCTGQPAGSPLVYLATDVHHPRSSPILSDFFNEFPCAMILSDFPKSVDELGQIYNTVDNVHMLPYMIALMDANMAAKGRDFYGTENSTFSVYIAGHLWPRYHPGQNISLTPWIEESDIVS